MSDGIVTVTLENLPWESATIRVTSVTWKRITIRSFGANPSPLSLTSVPPGPLSRLTNSEAGSAFTFGSLHLGAAQSSSSARASQVASRSTAVSNSGFRSTKSRSREASQSRVTVSSPRRSASSSMPRSVKYMPLRERRLDQRGLLRLVPLAGPGGRRRGRLPRAHLERQAGQLAGQVQRDERPRALVQRLVLYPDELGRVGVSGQRALDRGHRDRRELLDPDDGHILALGLLPV